MKAVQQTHNGMRLLSEEEIDQVSGGLIAGNYNFGWSYMDPYGSSASFNFPDPGIVVEGNKSGYANYGGLFSLYNGFGNSSGFGQMTQSGNDATQATAPAHATAPAPSSGTVPSSPQHVPPNGFYFSPMDPTGEHYMVRIGDNSLQITPWYQQKIDSQHINWDGVAKDLLNIGVGAATAAGPGWLPVIGLGLSVFNFAFPK